MKLFQAPALTFETPSTREFTGFEGVFEGGLAKASKHFFPVFYDAAQPLDLLGLNWVLGGFFKSIKTQEFLV